MNLKAQRRRAAKIHALFAQGIEPLFLAERFDIAECTISEILSAPVPEDIPCDGCGGKPGWASAITVGPVLLCRPCATHFSNNPVNAYVRWPNTFPKITE